MKKELCACVVVLALLYSLSHATIPLRDERSLLVKKNKEKTRKRKTSFFNMPFSGKVRLPIGFLLFSYFLPRFLAIFLHLSPYLAICPHIFPNPSHPELSF